MYKAQQGMQLKYNNPQWETVPFLFYFHMNYNVHLYSYVHIIYLVGNCIENLSTPSDQCHGIK